MNIFILSESPVEAAQMHCDKHICKMCVEAQQILCCVYHNYASHLEIPYKISHNNHPSCKWARASRGNFEWLLRHSEALCEEYTKRYGKYHKSQEVLEWCKKHKEQLIFNSRDLQPFAIAIGPDNECRKRIVNFDQKSAVEKYRLYYVFDKPFAVWKNSQAPEWFTELKQKYRLC